MQEKRTTKTYSYTRRIIAVLYLFSILLFILFAVYALVIMNQFRSLINRETRRTLDLYNAQISDNLRNVDVFLIELSDNSSDVALIGSVASLENRYDSVARVQDYFQYNIRSYSDVNGFFTYFPKNETIIAYSADSYDSNYFVPHLRRALRAGDGFAERIASEKRKWVLYPFGEKNYFIRLFREGNVFAGAWTDTDRLASALDQLNDSESLIVFSDSEGRTLAGEKMEIEIPFGETLSGSARVQVSGKSYLAVSVKLDYCDYYLSALIPYSSVYAPVLSTARFLVTILLVTLILVLFVLRRTRHFVYEPVRLLGETARRISEGDTKNRVDTADIHVRETLDIVNTFNDMIDSIEQLRINIYEEQLQKDEIEMHYLQTQVSPHFFINCLNLIGTLADGGATYARVIHELISVLAKHLRYTLRTKNDTTLAEELSYVENYMKMTDIRFPGCLTYTIECPPEAEKAAVFPLILLMFTENTIKFNMVMGEALQVVIRAEIVGNKDNPRLHLVHIDSGSGFTAETLDYYASPPGNNAGDPDSMRAHVGIYNVMRRLKLYYGETAFLALSNEEGMGARVDIDVPLIFGG